MDNVRMIDMKTGKWINGVTARPYLDYLDTSYGKTREYVRIDIYWDEEGDAEERCEAMMKIKDYLPLPRIDLNY